MYRHNEYENENNEYDQEEPGVELTEIRIKKGKPKKPVEEQPMLNTGNELGPGQYDPSVDYVKHQAPSCNWGASRTTRDIGNRNDSNPGPGNYNQ